GRNLPGLSQLAPYEAQLRARRAAERFRFAKKHRTRRCASASPIRTAIRSRWATSASRPSTSCSTAATTGRDSFLAVQASTRAAATNRTTVRAMGFTVPFMGVSFVGYERDGGVDRPTVGRRPLLEAWRHLLGCW